MFFYGVRNLPLACRSQPILSRYISKQHTMDLQKLVSVLKSLAPLELAGKWDNVGLLVEPSCHSVKRLLLTIDLTIPVLKEARDLETDMIISYHPPIFKPFKRMRQTNVKERIILQCIENRIAVYSPHTSYDAAENGVNDWLISAFGSLSDKRPVLPAEGSEIVAVERSSLLTGISSNDTKDSKFLKYGQMQELESNGPYLQAVQIDSKTEGMGRMGKLDKPATVRELLEKVKGHLGLSQVRMALGEGKSLESEVTTVACCAGSGASVLQDCEVDLYVTGEMSHHEVLHATSMGRTVILCEHSNTERGFLTVMQKRLENLLGDIKVIVSKSDKDPIQIV